MAICFHNAAVVFALLFTWFLASRARPETAPARLQPLDLDFVVAQDLPELFERPYRSSDRAIRPRSTRVGDDLFIARGYGKRAGNSQQMPLMIPRGYGKRSEAGVDRLLCLITKCKNYATMDAQAPHPATPDED